MGPARRESMKASRAPLQPNVLSELDVGDVALAGCQRRAKANPPPWNLPVTQGVSFQRRRQQAMRQRTNRSPVRRSAARRYRVGNAHRALSHDVEIHVKTMTEWPV